MRSTLSSLNLKLNINPSNKILITDEHNNNNDLYHKPTPSTSPISPSPISCVVTPPQHIEQKEETDDDEDEEEEEQEINNLVILDWDDTLCPTTYILNDKNSTNYLELQSFGKYLYEFLDSFIKIYKESNIYIVTNASKQWVYKSIYDLSVKYDALCSLSNKPKHAELNYFAAIYNSLITLNISIISAFDLFNKQYPNQPLLWKINAFKAITNSHFIIKQNTKYNIISIGDSDNEYIASLEAKSILKQKINNNQYHNNNILLHRIKLTDDPSINDMMKQMKYLTDNLLNIYDAKEPITIRFDYY